MKSTDMPARYVGGNVVDLLYLDNIYIQLRTITILHKNTKATRVELIYNGQLVLNKSALFFVFNFIFIIENKFQIQNGGPQCKL